MKSMQGDRLRFILQITGSCIFMRAASACLLIFSFATLRLHAQQPASFLYDQSSGLACGEIYDVLQDRKGFMWLASDRGVFRFDGYSFESFTTARGLPDNTVFGLEEDRYGRIWLLPFNGELCYISNDSVILYPYNDLIRQNFRGIHIPRSVYVCADGTVQIGLLMHGMLEISADGKMRTIDPGIATPRTFFAYENAEGGLVLSTLVKAVPYDQFYFKLQSAGRTVQVEVKNDGTQQQFITGLHRANGTWCFSTSDELIEIATDGSIRRIKQPGQVFCLAEDSQKNLWLGLSGAGARKYAAGNLIDTARCVDYFPGEFITALMEDREGAFWFCTHHNGVIYVPFIDVQSWQFPKAEADAVVCILPGAPHVVYALWRDHGLTSIQNGSLQVFPVSENRKETFRTMIPGRSESEIIIGANQTIISFVTATRAVEVVARRTVNCIAVKENKLYCGLSWNLAELMADNSLRVVGDPAVRHRPDILYLDRGNRLWIGALDGVYRAEDSALVPYMDRNRLLGSRVAGMCELTDSTLVIATQSNGVAFMKNERVRTVTRSDQFQCDHILSCAAGRNNTCWISTSEDLYRIDASSDSLNVQSFPGMKTLLGEGGPCYYSQPDSMLWIANTNGIICFNPDRKNAPDEGPPVFIRAVRMNDSLLNAGAKAELGSDENYIHIDYSGLAYRLQGKLLYRYRLTPGATWQYTRANSVDFAAMSPGDYRFEVAAQNENGAWSETPAVFSFTVHASFWQTRWFKMALVAFIIACALMVFQLRYRIIRRRDQLQERALIFRQQALASQMNPHFVFNALNTIQSFVVKENKTKALDMFSSFAALLRKSLEQASERYISLEEEIKTLELYFELEMMRFEKLQYRIEVASDIDTALVMIPAMLVQPLAENAIKHGIQHKITGGTVTISFAMEEEVLRCTVNDDGIGRKAAAETEKKSRTSSGLRITGDRLKVLAEITKTKYAFDIHDEFSSDGITAAGTTVKFIIPHIYKSALNYEKAQSPAR